MDREAVRSMKIIKSSVSLLSNASNKEAVINDVVSLVSKDVEEVLKANYDEGVSFMYELIVDFFDADDTKL
jgi:hypothetical protein